MASIIDQYRTIVLSAGWADLSTRGRLAVEGSDAISFLQALVSNDVASLSSGTGLYATYLTAQGRMLADLELYRRGDSILASVAPGRAASLASRLDQLVFAEDVRISDVSSDLLEFVVVGGEAARFLAEALDASEPALSGLLPLAQIDWRAGFVARSAEARLPIFKIVAPAAERHAVISGFTAAGLVPVSDDLLSALRVDAGRPLFGVDMTEDTIPLEAGLLERTISTTKGCYVGQEIIIRILHRGGGRVAKRLVTLRFQSDDETLRPGTELARDGRHVGTLTSVAPSLDGASTNALAYVHRDAAEIDNEVVAGSLVGTVTGFAG